jgi:hypothetical protein
MKTNRILFPLIFLFFVVVNTVAQSNPEQQLENLVANAETEEATDDDFNWQELEQFRRHPVNLNEADESTLKQLSVLNELQVESLLTYRRLLGKLVHVLELQAIPGWDISLIRQLIPYISIGPVMSLRAETGKRFRQGEHQLLLRIGQTLEQSAEYKKAVADNGYQGSPQRVLFRYTYRFKNNLQYGWLGDKDAGESFFKRSQKKGFDFYSVHLFARRIGIIQSLAIGDFTVNLGQGLIHWQSLAFKKSTEITAIKRQSAVLRPYHSAGEFNFHRGLGVTIKKGKIESTLFVSLRKISSNINRDTIQREEYVTSILTGGYHRNKSELEDRNNLTQLAAGGNIQYRYRRLQVGMNVVYYHFSLPVQKRDEPYNLFVWRGTHWKNAGIDYSYTLRNFHFFGEAAVDQRGHTGFIQGLLLSADPKVDISLVHRKIAAAYQSVNGNAFTESTLPSNETGFYTGLSIRPVAGWKLDGYADLFHFPWLKYRVDAPGSGKDWVVQLSYTPNRETLLYTRYRQETKPGNAGDGAVTNPVIPFTRETWRTQLNGKFSPEWIFRSRLELVWYNRTRAGTENGFLSYFDLLYKPMLRPWSGAVRMQYSETDGYNSRIYAYENDVLYSYSIPVFSGKGYRYYINMEYDLGKAFSVWVKWAQTLFREKKYAGGGGETAEGGSGTEFRIQFRYIFQ